MLFDCYILQKIGNPLLLYLFLGDCPGFRISVSKTVPLLHEIYDGIQINEVFAFLRKDAVPGWNPFPFTDIVMTSEIHNNAFSR